MKKIIFIIVTMLLLITMIGAYLIYCSNTKDKGLIDDWKYSIKKNSDNNFYFGSKTTFGIESAMVLSESSSMDSTIGLSVGGSKNINNFRENIKNGYFPISTDITYNGLFYDYYFNTGDVNKVNNTTDMFYPVYSTAISKDPISNKYKYYMTVGLNSNIKESDFQRKKLNLIVVMDISGSMSSGFNSYYYDGKGENEENESKMTIANESLNLLIDELKPEDKLGIVLFDNDAYLAKEVHKICETDTEAIKNHILEIKAQGGTNFEAGYNAGTELFTQEMLEDSEYENRIVVITDAMPNMGKTSKNELVEDIKDNANKGIYTTFIGVGVDFNTEVVETLSDVKGANYYSVHSSQEFKKIMSEDFEYMVTPLAFDIELTLDSTDYKIENVYGTDTQAKNTGKLIKVNTLFPSSKNEKGETKGGIILVELGTSLSDYAYQKNKIIVSYKDRNGEVHKNEQDFSFEIASEEHYDNTGIRKGIALTRYANLMKNWILYERKEDERFLIDYSTGIKDCDYTIEQVTRILGENERTSVKLTVSDKYRQIFKDFKEYLENEIKEIGDDDMKQEIDILNILLK